MRNPSPSPSLFWTVALALSGLLFSACESSTASEDEVRLDFNLNDSLKNYSQVFITIHDLNSADITLDTVFMGKLVRPATLSTYAVPATIGKDFQVRIQGFDAEGLLALESHILVVGGNASSPRKTPAENLPGWKPIAPNPVDTVPVIPSDPVEPQDTTAAEPV